MSTETEIAIIGMGCRFPGADSPSEFWSNIIAGKESIEFFSNEDLRRNGISENLIGDPGYVKSGFVLQDIEKFDAEFFGFTARDAQILDPQHRLFLECCWHALEHSGQIPERVEGRVGVYAGVFSSSYLLNIYSHPGLVESVGELAVRHGNEKDYLTTRLSYKLGLRGPSVSVQTSCSTSLVAVHMAVQSLLSGECDMALAGAVSVRAWQKTGYLYQAGGLTSPDGHCRPFDASAGGTVFGSGLGVVVLKRLDDALADRDTIYAVIKGSAINNDGSDKVGFTAPSASGQADVIAEAMAMADIDPSSIGLMEAHGTGTPLGDPIEIEALTCAWRSSTDRVGYCALGSVKSNVGHLGAASGVAGLIKASLALHHKVLAPTINFTTLNPNIHLADSPFYVNTAVSPWPDPVKHPRRAAVSSFGMGGTNAHVVLEEAPLAPGQGAASDHELLVLSARSSDALQVAMRQLRDHLQCHPKMALNDLAHTLRVGRRHFAHRVAFVADTTARAAAILAGEGGAHAVQRTILPVPQVAFLFPGQGSQYAGMCRGLYESQPAFRRHFDHCRALLHKIAPSTDPLRLLCPRVGEQEDQCRSSQIQPALFAVEYALARMLMDQGIFPSAMLGHSMGEYVCATLAEVFTVEDALRLLELRGRLMDCVEAGRMLAVPLSEARLLRYVRAHESLDIAAVNHPDQCVVAGPQDPLALLEATLRQSGVSTQYLQTSHAFHCGLLDPIATPFREAVAATQLKAPTRPYLSSVTGDWITAEQATSVDYWCDHLRRTVRFGDGVEKLLSQAGFLFVEVGPGTALTGLVQSRLPCTQTGRAIALSRHRQDVANDKALLLRALGQLWAHGVELQEIGDEASKPRRVELPLYPFDRKRYWIDRLWNTAVVPPQVGPDSGRDHGLSYAYRWERQPYAACPQASLLPDWQWAGDMDGKLATALREAAQHSEADSAAPLHVFMASGGYAVDSLSAWVKRLAADSTRDSLRIAVVTQQAANIAEPFALDVPSSEVLLALCELRTHHPDLCWLQLDIGQLPTDPAGLRRMARRWVDDLASPHRCGTSLAWRGGRRFVLTLSPVDAASDRLALAIEGAVLIVASSSALALSVAGALHTAQGWREMVFVLGPEAGALDGSSAEAEMTRLAHLKAAGVQLTVYPCAIEPHALCTLIERHGDICAMVCQCPDVDMAQALLQAAEHNPQVAQLDYLGCFVEQPLLEGTSPLSERQLHWALQAARMEEFSMMKLGLIIGSDLALQAEKAASVVGARGLFFLETEGGAAPTPHLLDPPATAAPDGSGNLAGKLEKIESAVIELWTTLFGIHSIVAEDDFFALGGTSLVAIQMISKVRERFGVELSIESLFDEPTVRGLARQIQALMPDRLTSGGNANSELLCLADGLSLQDLEAALTEREPSDAPPHPGSAASRI